METDRLLLVYDRLKDPGERASSKKNRSLLVLIVLFFSISFQIHGRVLDLPILFLLFIWLPSTDPSPPDDLVHALRRDHPRHHTDRLQPVRTQPLVLHHRTDDVVPVQKSPFGLQSVRRTALDGRVWGAGVELDWWDRTDGAQRDERGERR